MKTINIMTSCDGNSMKFIPVQLESIAANLSDRKINFYLFHDGKNIAYVNKLRKIKYNNIKFHDIIVDDTQIYDEIAKMGGGWCGAAYYSLCAHKYLPKDTDRVLYLDTADILIINKIDDYYFDDFEDKMLIVTTLRYKLRDSGIRSSDVEELFRDAELYQRKDLSEGEYFAKIAHGLFNSGSYVINLDKMRKSSYDIKDYLIQAKTFYESRDIIPKKYFEGKKDLGQWGDQVYWGDQGFISLLFVGDIKYFNYPKIRNTIYMPYNFGIWYFDRTEEELYYPISIIHYTGYGCIKPWQGKYQTFLKRFQEKSNLQELDKFNANQVKCYNIWYQYALMASRRLDNCK